MTVVKRDQFEIDGLVVRHIPTNARFSPTSDVLHWGLAGERLPNGDEYSRKEVLHVALQILHERESEPQAEPQ